MSILRGRSTILRANRDPASGHQRMSAALLASKILRRDRIECVAAVHNTVSVGKRPFPRAKRYRLRPVAGGNESVFTLASLPSTASVCFFSKRFSSCDPIIGDRKNADREQRSFFARTRHRECADGNAARHLAMESSESSPCSALD